jgi:hypothetical protein
VTAAEWLADRDRGTEASDTCAACKTRRPLSRLEPVPTRPHLVRCSDEDACRKRFTPRRLARSVATGRNTP